MAKPQNGHAGDDAEELTPAPPPAPLFPSVRLSLAVIGFFGFVMVYSLRVNLSVAVVCMVNQTAVDLAALEDETTALLNSTAAPVVVVRQPQCDRAELNATLPAKMAREGSFVWNKEIQGRVLGAFFYGYMCTQVLGGWLAERVGAKRIFALTALVAAAVSVATPAAASTHYIGLWICRFLLGFCQGAAFPAFHAMWSRWAPPLERSILVGLSYAGGQVGNVLTLPLSGMLCEYGPFGGWPSIFYILGGLSLVWIAVWLFWVSDYPATHPRMSMQEKAYIMHALAHQVDEDDQHRPPTPWRRMLTSPAFWAVVVGHFAGDWGAYTMLTCLPSFMNDVLSFDLQTMGFVASLPYIAYFVCINLGGFLADLTRQHNILNTLNTRRAAMIIALGSQAVFLILASYCKCGQEMYAVVFLILGMGLSGLQYAGFVVNYMDIAPAFAGSMLGIGNTLSCAAGILPPMIMGKMTIDKTAESWQQFFYVNAAIMLAGTLFFVIFAKGEVQKWALVEVGQEMEVLKVLAPDTEMSEKHTARYEQREDSSALLT